MLKKTEGMNWNEFLDWAHSNYEFPTRVLNRRMKLIEIEGKVYQDLTQILPQLRTNYWDILTYLLTTSWFKLEDIMK